MWDKLSMREKAAFIRTAVKNGIYDRTDIIGRYNKFAGGGPKEERPDSIELHTWRPLVDSSYKMTGHSALCSPARTFVKDSKYNNLLTGTDAIGINFVSQMPEYNLITNNCSDATRRALEAISGKKINPAFFTTPGDVKDFAEQELGGRSFYQNGHYVTRIPVTQKQREFLSSFSPYSTSSEGVRMKANGGPIVQAAMSHIYDGITEDNQF